MRTLRMEQQRNYCSSKTIIGIACLVDFAMWAPVLCVPPMGHIIERELNLSHTQAGLLYSIPILMIVILSVFGGILSDKIGIRKAAGIGVIIGAAGSLLRGLAFDGPSLLAFTFIFGAGVGLSIPNLPKLISYQIRPDRVGTSIGIYISVMIAGMALALAITIPVIFPITSSFQGVFLIWSIPLIMATVLWWLKIKEDAYDKPTNLIHEKVIPLLKVLRNKTLWSLATLFLLFAFFFDGWLAWAPALMMTRGAAEKTAGLLVSICMWSGIPTAILMPRLSVKVNTRKPFLWIPSITMALLALGVLYINVSFVLIPMILIGISFATIIPTVLTLSTEISSKQRIGTSVGLVLAVGNIGGILGPLVGGYIFDTTDSLTSFIFVLVGVSLAGAIIAYKIRENRRFLE